MTQNNVLMLTVASTIATAVVDILVELGRKQLRADLFHIEGAEAVVTRRHVRRDRRGRLDTVFLTSALNHRLPLRKHSARHV